MGSSCFPYLGWSYFNELSAKTKLELFKHVRFIQVGDEDEIAVLGAYGFTVDLGGFHHYFIRVAVAEIFV
jgi:hypothetical protein